MSGPVVVGFVPSPEGRAALEEATRVARESGAQLVIINSSRAASAIDPDLATGHDLDEVRRSVDAAGVACTVEHPVGDGQRTEPGPGDDLDAQREPTSGHHDVGEGHVLGVRGDVGHRRPGEVRR